jgi:hypothetical protein
MRLFSYKLDHSFLPVFSHFFFGHNTFDAFHFIYQPPHHTCRQRRQSSSAACAPSVLQPNTNLRLAHVRYYGRIYRRCRLVRSPPMSCLISSCSLTFYGRGIPVKTVDFLCHLDAFRKAIPTIHTLRLCNQFGRDDHAGITKLPKELIEIIEKELFASLCKKETRAADGWAKKYACFEGTCRTRDHIGKSDPKWYLSDDYADIRFELLHDHPEWWTGHRYKLPKNYPKLLEAELDNIGEYDLEEFWEVCYEKRHEWQSLVDEHMNNGGNKDVCTASGKSRN